MKEWKIVIFDAIKNTALKNEDIVAERNRIYYGFKNLYKIIEEYENMGFKDELLLAVTKKKIEFINNAKFKIEIKQILKPSVPKYNFGNFIFSKYHIEEEELLLWSVMSLKAPLNDEGFKRYFELFEKYNFYLY
ncbi:hypothetical protein B5E58_12690 [Tyzzerella sp. An114]|uniref:hypothetical protein n=1 Tax=Tyzzerella sp. An114 TaxID=1965545 RepID=UPI000B44BFD2|nr:hypothetical protein [Tyzzerella sp. An114]OUQ55213.1 hypothetical protein B5E58_12690 [Tyzzerella sp. An114]